MTGQVDRYSGVPERGHRCALAESGRFVCRSAVQTNHNARRFECSEATVHEGGDSKIPFATVAVGRRNRYIQALDFQREALDHLQ